MKHIDRQKPRERKQGREKEVHAEIVGGNTDVLVCVHLCPSVCVCACVCVVIALELLRPHVNYISNRGLLLCWARAQEGAHIHTHTHALKTHNEHRRQPIATCDGL